MVLEEGERGSGLKLTATGPSGGLLWTWLWTFGFHRRWGIPLPAERLSAIPKGLCYKELVMKLHGTGQYLRVRSRHWNHWWT